jgi:hypothetical protein
MELPSIPWEALTPPVLLGLAVLLLLTGRLIPRRTYDDMRQDRDHWREAHSESEALRAEMQGTLKPLLESAHTSEALLRSLSPKTSPPEGGE